MNDDNRAIFNVILRWLWFALSYKKLLMQNTTKYFKWVSFGHLTANNGYFNSDYYAIFSYLHVNSVNIININNIKQYKKYKKMKSIL